MPTEVDKPHELRVARLEKREANCRATLGLIEETLARMERAVGLRPWGEEAKPKAALHLVPRGGD